MISFSYHYTQNQKKEKMTSYQFERDMELRNELIEQEKQNQTLQKELKKKQDEVLEIERKLSDEADVFSELVKEAEMYRVYLGKVNVKGPGVQVTLSDAEYDPAEENVNNYIVHEYHIFQVINELNISGANAIAINGQRISQDSYILCNGPVIEVDGQQHFAPFVISAIGDADTMSAALNIKGGVKDILVNENVQFSLEKKDQMIMRAKFNS
jgi:uncharacterized protein YlxW (UPF0749 family)